ncbi:MAG: LLM class flavin-dependent oxidoreductase [Acidimicrobiia bacterium]|nr:LLM class flavin-dependent oxidoreductase [Acidimicrobiia bacterium]
MKVEYLQQFTYRDLPDDFSTRFVESVVTNPYAELVDPERMRAAFRDGLDELMHAARAGFDAVAVTEHGAANYDMSPNPDLTAAAVAYATEAEGIDVAIHVIGRTLGKTREPLRVAEEYAVLDNISGGRLQAGFPVGLAYDANYNYGVAPVETRARYAENLELILRAWTAREPFPWNGRYSQYPGVNIWPRPYQTPHPPISVTSIGTPTTADFALERDLGFNLVAFSGDPVATAKPAYDYFWNKAAELGLDDNPYRATYAQFVVVADTDAEAERLYARHVEYSFANGIGHIPLYRLAMPGGIPPAGLKHLMTSGAALGPTGPPTYRGLVESGAVVAGSPETVRERLAHLARLFRVGNLSVFLQLGSTPRDLTLASIDRFASGVLPHLRPIFAEYDDENRWWPVRLGGKPPSPRQAGTLEGAN